jgi:asparagine synthase (glutamine-hydrolysing)
MCGIAGFFSHKLDVESSQRIIISMTQQITRRGPDDSGYWVDEETGIRFGHRRLSILDLSPSGHQPMESKSGRFVIIFNGEIYNYNEIKLELKESGVINWRGHSDTEVILEYFELFGAEKTLQRLNGMFALSIWDKFEKKIYLARDRFGEKPLYYFYSNNKKDFIFASDLLSLKEHPHFEGIIDRNSISLFLRHNYIPAPYSIYQQTKKLLPGHYIVYDSKSGNIIQNSPFWKADDAAKSYYKKNIEKSFKECSRELEGLCKSVIKDQMISDVPIGAFLSGGVDSSLVVALMQSVSREPVKTFTIGFNEDRYNEAHYAKSISKILGTDHTEYYVSSKEAIEVIPNISSIYSEPFSDSSQIPTYLVSKLAKTKVTVSLSGDGGDELFGGYNRYFQTEKIWQKISKLPLFLRKQLSQLIQARFTRFLLDKSKYGNQLINNRIDKIIRIIKSENIDDIYFDLISHCSNPSDFILDSKEPNTLIKGLDDTYDFKNYSYIEKMMLMDTVSYLCDDILVKVDRAAMFNSLETRVPFLDQRIFNFAWSLPLSYKLNNGSGKIILKDILSRYIPQELINRPKMGFGIPIDDWLRADLKAWMMDMCNLNTIKQQGIFDSKMIQDLIDKHLIYKSNNGYQIWNILIFQSWLNSIK